MRAFVFFFLFLLAGSKVFSQTDSLLSSLQADTASQPLLPAKMLPSQRFFWGEHGLFRNASHPLTSERREKELRLRRKMLVAHQVLGFATLGGFIAQGIVGAQLYNNPTMQIRATHHYIASCINISYSLTALMSLTSPPPLVNRDRGITSIRIHKWLAVVHMAGMIATNILASKIEDHPELKPYHRAAAYTTFGAFTAAMLVIKLK
ncbi:MAG: hypothetical protein KGO81_06230 [Bacteroidota bacterium]|nr:hypothetical protein [Bacteroidota bacterium]